MREMDNGGFGEICVLPRIQSCSFSIFGKLPPGGFGQQHLTHLDDFFWGEPTFRETRKSRQRSNAICESSSQVPNKLMICHD